MKKNYKKAKITKQAHTFKNYAHSYKLKHLLNNLGGFKSVETLVLKNLTKQTKMTQNIVPFIQTQKLKQLFTMQTLTVYSNQSIVQL